MDEFIKREGYKTQKSEVVEKKDLSQNCDFDDDSDKNDCWHCIHFLFPIGCMYFEDGDTE